MKRKSVLVLILILVLVMALAFAGCGGNDNGNGGDPVGNGDEPGENNGDPGENGGGNGNGDIDWTDPEEVALAFLEVFSAGEFERALQFITYDAKFGIEHSKEFYAHNEYILEFWKVVMTYSDAEVINKGIQADNWVILNIEVTKPDFESLMPENEEVFMDTMVLLALSGIEMDEEITEYAEKTGKEFSDSAWNETFAKFKSAVDKAPTISENVEIELIEVDGEWKVDRFPDGELF